MVFLCVCLFTFSADIIVRGAGFGGRREETMEEGEGEGIKEEAVGVAVFFFSLSEPSACVSSTGDFASVSLDFSMTASLQDTHTDTHQTCDL